MDNISIYSLNCEGVKRNIEYISDISRYTSCDILCLQETWLLLSLHMFSLRNYNSPLGYSNRAFSRSNGTDQSMVSATESHPVP